MSRRLFGNWGMLGISIMLLTAASAQAVPVCSLPKAELGLVGNVHSVQFHPTDPNIVFVTGETVYLASPAAMINLETGRPVRRFGQHEVVVLSPDGKKVAALKIGYLKILDAETGEEIASFSNSTLASISSENHNMAFTPDSTKLLIWWMNEVQIWDVATGERLRTFPVTVPASVSTSMLPLNKPMISADGKTLFIGPHVYNLASGAEIRFLGVEEDYTWEYFSDGSYVLTSAGNLYETKTGTLVKTFENMPTFPYFWGAVISPDNKYVFFPRVDKPGDKPFETAGALWEMANDLVLQYLDEQPDMSCCAFSPDGERLLTGSTKGTIMLWDVQRDYTVQKFSGHNTYVNAVQVAFWPDGAVLTGNHTTPPRLWDASTGQVVHTFPGIAGLDKVAISPDENYAVFSFNAEAQLWDTAARQFIRSFSFINGYPGASFSSDSSKLVTSCNIVQMWDVQTGQLIREFGQQGLYPIRGALSPDGTLVVICEPVMDDTYTTTVYDATSGELLNTFVANGAGHVMRFMSSKSQLLIGAKCYDVLSGVLVRDYHSLMGIQRVYNAALSPDGRQVCLAGDAVYHDGSGFTVRTVDKESGALIRIYPEHSSNSSGASVAFSPDGRQLLTGTEIEGAILRPTSPSITPVQEYEKFGVQRESMFAMAFSPDGSHLLVAGPAGVALCDPTTGDIVRTYGTYGQGLSGATDVLYVGNGLQIKVARGNGAIERWDAATGELLHALDAQSLQGRTEYAGRFSGQDGRRRVYMENYSKTQSVVHVRDTETGTLVCMINFNHELDYGHDISWDGTLIRVREIIESSMTTFRARTSIWDVDYGAMLFSFETIVTIEDKTNKNNGAFPFAGGYSAFTPDGQFILAEGKIWNIATGQPVRDVPFDAGVWSPDGNQILFDGKLYDYSTGNVIRSFDAGWVYSAAFSPDGATMATNNYCSPTIRLWDVQTCSDPILIPSLVGMQRIDAETALMRLGLRTGVITEVFDTSCLPDSITGQRPIPDTRIDQGGAVDLEVCMGPGSVVPNVVGLSRSAAESLLAGENLSLGMVTEGYSDTVTTGCVISQIPAADTMVTMYSAVALHVSKGPVPSFVTVPNVVGMSRTNAGSALLAAGLAIGVEAQRCSNTAAEGVILIQSVSPGASVASGSTVSLTASSGPCSGEGESEGEGEGEPPHFGTLSVTIQPGEVLDDGAQWRVDSGGWLDSGATLPLAAGQHRVDFKDITPEDASGCLGSREETWVTPEGQFVTVTAGQQVNITGTYVQEKRIQSAAVTIKDGRLGDALSIASMVAVFLISTRRKSHG